jgi:hypothetical protein
MARLTFMWYKPTVFVHNYGPKNVVRGRHGSLIEEGSCPSSEGQNSDLNILTVVTTTIANTSLLREEWGIIQRRSLSRSDVETLTFNE